MCFKLLHFVDSLALVKKKISLGLLHGTQCNKPIKMRHTGPIFSSNVTHRSIGNKQHVGTLTYFRF